MLSATVETLIWYTSVIQISQAFSHVQLPSSSILLWFNNLFTIQITILIFLLAVWFANIARFSSWNHRIVHSKCLSNTFYWNEGYWRQINTMDEISSSELFHWFYLEYFMFLQIYCIIFMHFPLLRNLRMLLLVHISI